jgi:dTDP-L-rhamnose 4-epimerase
MRVLVTGGAGFIGSFLVDRLLALGHAVRVLDVLDPQVHPDNRPAYLAPGAEVQVADIRDRRACEVALAGVEMVVHAAAAVGVAQSLYRVEHYVDVNVRGTATLLDAIAAQGGVGRLVLLTSMTAYGEGLYRRPSDGRVRRIAARSEPDIRRWGWEPVCPETHEPLVPVPTPEEAELSARNVYALTKRYQEELATSLAAVYGFPVVCLRLFNVYGPRQSLANPYTGVVAIFLGRLLTGRPPIVYEDGAQTRDFVSVHDVTTAVVAAIERPVSGGIVVNIGSGVPRRIADVARDLARIAGVPDIEPRITGQFRRGDIRHCYADGHRARALLGFEPRLSWEAGLTELVRDAVDRPVRDRVARAEAELRARALLTGPLPAPTSLAHP